MKKLICIIIAVIGLLSVSVLANAAEMTDEQKNDLLNFDIMTGDPNGDLRLNDTITRAEAIKMICTAGNIGTEIIELNAFPDVPATHWAHNYIAAAKAMEIVSGDENGNFNPESKVTNEEIVKMTVCLLGYEPMAYNRGGYPAGYTAVATQIGLVEDMQLEINAPAIRNDVGIMIHNALGIPIMQEKSNGKDADVTEYVIMDGLNGFKRIILKDGFKKYDSSRDNISKLSKEFASQYPYKEGDTEKSFELYPNIIYTSGIEKTDDGKEYECPAIYDDLMVSAEVNNIKKDMAKVISGIDKEYHVEYITFNNKLLVPLNILETAGCDIQFDKLLYVAKITKNSTVIEIMPNLIGMRKNQAAGFWIPLEVCARFVDNVLYVPLEAIAAEFDIAVEWNSATKTLILK